MTDSVSAAHSASRWAPTANSSAFRRSVRSVSPDQLPCLPSTRKGSPLVVANRGSAARSSSATSTRASTGSPVAAAASSASAYVPERCEADRQCVVGVAAVLCLAGQASQLVRQRLELQLGRSAACGRGAVRRGPSCSRRPARGRAGVSVRCRAHQRPVASESGRDRRAGLAAAAPTARRTRPGSRARRAPRPRAAALPRSGARTAAAAQRRAGSRWPHDRGDRVPRRGAIRARARRRRRAAGHGPGPGARLRPSR